MPAMTGEMRYHSSLAPPMPPPRVLRVPAEHATIQAAIDAAGMFRDTVLVAPGDYPGTIQFKGKYGSI